mgnify:CR=1 FL=1
MKIDEEHGYCPICRSVYYGLDRCPIHGKILRKKPRRKHYVCNPEMQKQT